MLRLTALPCATRRREAPSSAKGIDVGLWLGLIGAVAAASVSLAAEGSDEARNQCRVDCARTWMVAQVCAVDPTAIVPVKPIRCRKKADKAYQVCLADCGPLSPIQSPVPDAKPAEPAVVPAPAAKPKD